jgi:uncharacterized membrane protein YeaQ/YmgE (transglycosylase-associated protein family)
VIKVTRVSVGATPGGESRGNGRRVAFAPMLRVMLILGLILFGMIVGAGAQLVLGSSTKQIDWTLAIVAGLVGSFVGGLLASLIAGDGLELRPSGLIGSFVGAVVVTAVWQWWNGRKATA